mgnify:CR=1 FL=1
MRRLAWVVLLSGCLLHDEPDGEGPTVATPEAAEASPAPRSAGLAAVTRQAVDDAREDAEDDQTPAPAPGGSGPIARPSDGPPAGASKSELELFAQAERARLDDRLDDMKQAYLQLIREFPMSPLVPDVYAALGEHYFDRGQFEQAGRLFEKVTTFPSTPATVWGHYMLAWCDMRSSDPAGALDHFVRAQKGVEAGDYGSGDPARELAIAIRGDIVLPYAEAGKPARARAFFERLEGGTGTDDVPVAVQLQRLQVLLAERGDAEGARTVCRDRIARGESVTCDP